MIEPRAAAAVGQSGLMSLYDAMFSQYGVKIAQVLVTKPDFYNEETRRHLASTVSELISLNIVPIINTNDAVSPPPMVDEDLAGVISIKDNDSLAARLACEVNADLLILMSDVDGIYTCPPSEEGARLINTYCPEHAVTIQYGKKSRVGLGGMDSKVRSACWALEKGVSVVICNGMADSAIRHIIAGRKLGTFFTATRNGTVSVESAAEQGSIYLLSFLPSSRDEATVTFIIFSLISVVVVTHFLSVPPATRLSHGDKKKSFHSTKDCDVLGR